MVIGTYVPAEPTGATSVPGAVRGRQRRRPDGPGASSAAAQGLTAAGADQRRPRRRGHPGGRSDRMTEFDEEFWEERYRSQPAVWSGRPNAAARRRGRRPARRGGRWTRAAARAPTRSGWPGRGWQVTAVDFATAALRKAADHAAAAGVADRIEWRHADLTAWPPEEAAYDLVSAQFVHLPQARRAAVRPPRRGGRARRHPARGRPRPERPGDRAPTATRGPERFFSADDVAAKLDPARWLIEVAEARPRLSKHHEGDNITVHDAVLRAQRRAASDTPTAADLRS